MTRISLSFACALGIALVATAARADRGRGRGHGHVYVLVPGDWYGGIGAVGTKVIRQDGGPELLFDGVGFDVYGGLRFSPVFALEIGWFESFHNPAEVDTYYGTAVDYLVLDAFTIDARVYTRWNSHLETFLKGGIGGYALSSEHFGLDSLGSGFQLGGGADLYLSDNLTLTGIIQYRGIVLGPPNSDIRDTYISALTLGASLGLHY